jgi:methionine-rich copper-binding protein CopC
MTRFTALFIGALASIALVAPAKAHPKLVAASPAANATVASPQHITLRFTEKLLPKFSSADLVMTDMPGMKMKAPMKMATSTMIHGADGKSLMVMTSKPLPAGTYKLTWRVVGGDSHPITGGYNFRVK